MAALMRISVLGLVVAACAGGRPKVEELLPPSAATPTTDPVLAVDPGTGDLLLAWVQRDGEGWQVMFSRSTVGTSGVAWSAPVRVTASPDEVHPLAESSPRLVAGPGGRVAVAWTKSIPAPGRRWAASAIRFSRSMDGGLTWTPAITLNDDAATGAGGHIFHGAAWRGDSGLVVAWMDERGGTGTENPAAPKMAEHHPETMEEPDATIYLAESGDFGRSWGANRPLWGASCPCCRVALAREVNGAVVAGWRKHFGGNVRDVVVASLDGDSIEKVQTDDWVYPGCPSTGPGLVVGGDGTAHVAWYTGKPGAAGVRYARRDAVGSFGDPVVLLGATTLPTAHPRVAARPDGGAWVVWDVTAGGASELVVARIGASRVSGTTVVPNTAGADHPEVVTLGDGTGVVVWTSRQGGSEATRIRLARITQ